MELPDGATVWAQVTDSGPSDVALDRIPRALKGLPELLRGVATNVRDGLTDITPTEVSVEFGIELAMADEGLVAALAGVTGSASIKVTMSWSAADSAVSR